MTDRTDWQDRVGDTWAAEWRRTDRSFAGLAPALDAAILAAAPPTGRAVDIGTGAGATAAAFAAARPAMSVIGIDLSTALLATARAERAPLPNLRFVAGDVLTAAVDAAPVDLFFSRHGVMFFDDPAAAFAVLRRAARPDTALVFSCFAPRADNGWIGVLDAVLGPSDLPRGYAPGPFAFADPAMVGDILRRSGWVAAAPAQIGYRYVVGEGETDDAALADALSFFTRIGPAAPVIAAAAPDDRARVTDRLRAELRPHCRGGVVALDASAWIWTARAGEAA